MTPPESAGRARLGGGPGALRRRADPRLPAYLVAGFGALVAAIATGEHELAALAAPFLALVVTGLADRRSPGVSATLTLRGDRAVEGDLLEGEVHVSWDGDAEVDVMLDGWRGVTPVDPSPVVGWALSNGRGPRTLPFTLRARSWGVHDVGALWVRARRVGSFFLWEQRVTPEVSVRVLPSPLRLSRLLEPAEPRLIAGMHVARARGHGSDFAELRPYRPGDRLRDLSWTTSARLRSPWVRVNHPERTGTVVLLLDAVFGNDRREREALARVARATWAVASMHLRAQDRVGLVARGRTTAWLPPGGGRRARWMLLDELLGVGRAAEDMTRRRYVRSRVAIPPDALIVGVTTLRAQTFVPELLHHRRTGHRTVALVIDTADLLPEARGVAEGAALRIWQAQRKLDRRQLERGGVLTTVVDHQEGVGAAILGLRRRMNAIQQPARTAVTVR